MRLIRHYALITFFALAFALTWANWVPRALASRGLIDLAVPEWIGLVAGYGPALAALIVTALTGGRAAVGALLRRLGLWRVGVQWYGLVLLLPAAISLAALGLHLLFGGATPRAAQPPAMIGPFEGPLWLQGLGLLLIFILGFDGLGEELGWRGFALPRLLARHTALTASLILGALWALWHLPYALTLGSAMSALPFYTYVPGILATAVLYTWVFNHTRGSLLIAILFHAAGNTTANLLPALLPAVQDVAWWWTPVVQWAAALVVIAYAGPAHLSRAPVAPVPETAPLAAV